MPAPPKIAGGRFHLDHIRPEIGQNDLCSWTGYEAGQIRDLQACEDISVCHDKLLKGVDCLPAKKLRGALLQKSRRAFLFVLCGGAETEVRCFEQKAFTLTGIQTLVHGIEREFHRYWRVGRDAF